MSVLSQTRDVATVEAADPAPLSSPTVITEHEILLGTAAAVSFPRHDTGHRLAAAVRRTLASLRELPAPPTRYPSVLDYLESSRMAREMCLL